MTERFVRRSAIIAVFLTFVLALQPALARQNGISAGTIQSYIAYLASDELAGRMTGEKGNEEAARFVAAAFRRAGLKPLGTSRQNDANAKPDGSGYFQPFTFTAGTAEGKNNRLQAVVGRKSARYRLGTEFEPAGISLSGEASGEVIFAGYGIVSNEPARDDYAGQNVRGKIVLALAGVPTIDPHSPLQAFVSARRKAVAAREKGAAALLLVLPKDSDAPHMDGIGVTADAGIPVLIVRRSVAAAWLKAAGKSLEEVEKALAAAPQAFPTGVQAALQTDVKKVTKTTANIAGYLEGSDPALRNEVVVIGAHMDHLGMGGPYSMAEDKKPAIHHGADDNASGTAGVMALAEAFAAHPIRPKRSIVFMCFSGEELGLLGSAHYTQHPLIPMDRTVAMLNMDMIGRMRDNKLIVVGSGTSPAWNPLLDDLNKAAHFTLNKNDAEFGGSDHQSFYLQKVPVLFFFTGLHADYHRPSDTADKINSMDEARIVSFVGDCAERIADNPERPAYQQMTAPREGGPARFRVTLGTIPDYAAEVEGVALSGVRPGSPAEKAGLKAGDVIVKFGGKSVRNIQDYSLYLSERNPGEEVEIVVKRGSETLTLKATLGASQR
jgi:aminopeptidase YwaD